MQASATPLLTYAAKLLHSQVTILQAFVRQFEAGYTQPTNYVAAPKLLLVVEGHIDYWLDECQWQLEPGSMLYRPGWSAARWKSDVHCTLAAAEYLADAPDLPVLDPLVLAPESAAIEAAAIGRIAGVEGGDAASLTAEAEFKAVAVRFFTRLYKRRPTDGTASWATSHRGTSTTANGAKAASGSRATRAATEAAAAYLKAHFRESLAIEHVAEQFHLSNGTFRRVFRTLTNMSPQRYVITLRMYAAWHFLNDSDYSVKEVAVYVGYDDPLYFSRLFHAYWGFPPTRIGPFRPFPWGSDAAIFPARRPSK